MPVKHHQARLGPSLPTPEAHGFIEALVHHFGGAIHFPVLQIAVPGLDFPSPCCLCVFLSLFSRSTRGLNWRGRFFPLGPVGGGGRSGASGAPKTGWVKAASRP
jgi:hypothetical protein